MKKFWHLFNWYMLTCNEGKWFPPALNRLGKQWQKRSPAAGSRCISGQDAFCQGREAVLNMTVGHDSFHHIYPRPQISEEVILLENLFEI